MSARTMAADDADVVKEQIDRLNYERLCAPLFGGCAALRGGSRDTCDQCRGESACSLCKNKQPGNTHGAKFCVICDLRRDGTNLAKCPT